MKKFSFIFAALSALTVFSCKKDIVLNNEEIVGENNGVILVNLFDAAAPDTRSSVKLADYEEVITSAQVFVFSNGANTVLGTADGELETDKYVTMTASGSTSMTLTTAIGSKRIWAIVNAPRLTNITKEADLKAATSSLRENYFEQVTVAGETRRGLVMAGAVGYTSGKNAIAIAPGNVTVSKYTVGSAAQSIEIPVYRLGASIQLKKVTVDFRSTSLKDKPFVIKKIYLKNVVNRVALDGTATGNAALSSQANWSNQIKYNGGNWLTIGTTDIKDLIYDKDNFGTDGLLCNNAGGETLIADNANNGGYYYVYPNATTEDNNGDTWAPRRTRLVIHATIGGVDSYYPVSIADPHNYAEGLDAAEKVPNIVGNRQYIINHITITSKGKPHDNDDKEPETGMVEGNITIADWAGNTLLEYDF